MTAYLVFQRQLYYNNWRSGKCGSVVSTKKLRQLPHLWYSKEFLDRAGERGRNAGDGAQSRRAAVCAVKTGLPVPVEDAEVGAVFGRKRESIAPVGDIAQDYQHVRAVGQEDRVPGGQSRRTVSQRGKAGVLVMERGLPFPEGLPVNSTLLPLLPKVMLLMETFLA